MQKRAASIAALADRSMPTVVCEADMLDQDGSRQRVLVTHRVSGEHVIDVLMDMTDRDRLLAQDVKLQRMESLFSLCTGFAHNFNNALTSVLGYISMARKYLEQQHKSSPLLLNAEECTEKAAYLVAQLQNCATGGLGQRHLPVPVPAMLEQIMASLPPPPRNYLLPPAS